MKSITHLSKENNHQNNKLMMCISLQSIIHLSKENNHQNDKLMTYISLQCIIHLSKENKKFMMCISLLSIIHLSKKKCQFDLLQKAIAIGQPQKDSSQQSLSFG
jgi:hypothetical protein